MFFAEYPWILSAWLHPVKQHPADPRNLSERLKRPDLLSNSFRASVVSVNWISFHASVVSGKQQELLLVSVHVYFFFN